jgi:hypothetical protein
MARPLVALSALSCALSAGFLLAGCGSSGRSSSPLETTTATPPNGSLQSLAGATPIAIVPGTQDFQPGRNRVSFLIIDRTSRAISTPTARVWVATSLSARPFEQTTARSEPVGVPGGAKAPVGTIYVTHVRLPKPGKYWLLAVPTASPEPLRALGNLVVPTSPNAGAPRVGTRAIPSHTPTLASAGGKIAAISTATHPDPRLYRISIAQAIASHQPFVVTFATPRFCTSRTCGPTVDVLAAVAKRFAATSVRFIHVEIYKDNDPAKGSNQWVTQWRLPTEPYTFLVDRRGIIRERFEGAVSVAELEAAVRSELVG